MRDIVSPLAGFSSPFGQRRDFSPFTLFAGGEEGVWYDPSDLTTLFQDVAGTTPVTTPGQTVALMLDQSGNDYHATQSTAAARPKYGIVPETGRRNLLRYTEQFDNAAWGKVGTTTPVSLGDGVFRLDGFGDAGGDRLLQTLSLSPSTLTAQVQVKGEGSDIGKDFQITAKRASGGTSTFNSQIITLTGDWQTVTTTFTMAQDNVAAGIYFTSPNNSAAAPLVRFPQFELGSTATAYQRVTTDLDVTEAGVPSLGYLSFDGVDDVLISPSAVFFGEASSMILGAETFSDSASRTVCSDLGSQGLQFATTGTYGFVNNVTIGSGGVRTTTPYLSNRVVSFLRSDPQNSAFLQIDGTSVASTTHDQTDSVSRPLCVGGRPLAAFGSMNFFSLVHIARFINEAELSRTERYIAQKTGVTL